MLKIIGYVVFILSVALAAGGIMLTSKLRNRYRSDIFSTLLYYQVFIYTFGFYGLWGQAVIKMFLSLLLSPEMLMRISNIEILLGLPFLVFAWLMLIKFSGSLSGRKSGNWFVFLFLFANFSILAAFGLFVAKTEISNPEIVIRYYYIIMNIIYSFIASFLIHLPAKGGSVIHEHDRKIVAPLIFLIMIILCSVLLFIDAGPWMGIVFIFIFFLGNTFLPVFFRYGTLLSSLSPATENKTGFEEFCRRFEVSPRESEVIMEICNGLSNKEISDKLFISLQTVKDHTHRIYIKTNVRSRVRLINLINEMNSL
jgi:DNA-binding CsgD family transcriptional regulator